jgi:hypothetical protein
LKVPAYHITLPDLPNRWSSTYHLRGPPGLRLTTQHPKEPKGNQNPKSCKWEPPLDFYRNRSSKHSIANGNHHVIGLTRVIKKVGLNATIEPYNSNKLNAQS